MQGKHPTFYTIAQTKQFWGLPEPPLMVQGKEAVPVPTWLPVHTSHAPLTTGLSPDSRYFINKYNQRIGGELINNTLSGRHNYLPTASITMLHKSVNIFVTLQGKLSFVRKFLGLHTQ